MLLTIYFCGEQDAKRKGRLYGLIWTRKPKSQSHELCRTLYTEARLQTTNERARIVSRSPPQDTPRLHKDAISRVSEKEKRGGETYGYESAAAFCSSIEAASFGDEASAQTPHC
jgi:hypothetical protein